MTRELTPLDLAISKIEASCRVWEVKRSVRGGRLAWLLLSGDCCSARDAMWIQWQIDAATRLSDCSALLLDLRDLTDLRDAHEPLPVLPRQQHVPMLVVATDKLTARVPPDVFRTDLDAARAELEQILRTPRPQTRAVRYAWSEAWIDATADVRVLRRGETFDIFDPATPHGRIEPLASFADEELAQQWLRERGFSRVEGRI